MSGGAWRWQVFRGSRGTAHRGGENTGAEQIVDIPQFFIHTLSTKIDSVLLDDSATFNFKQVNFHEYWYRSLNYYKYNKTKISIQGVKISLKWLAELDLTHA